jgi:hypothetical protein
MRPLSTVPVAAAGAPDIVIAEISRECVSSYRPVSEVTDRFCDGDGK